MRLILIRHYRTRFNASQQIMGWGDSPQADDWLLDMHFVEAQLRAHAVQPDAIYSSALGRSRRTAQYFANQWHIPAITSSPALNEVNYGGLYEKDKAWVATHYPQHKQDPDMVYPQGESFTQMQLRSAAFIEKMIHREAGKAVLCVVHAGVIRALLSHFLGLALGPQLKRKVSHRYIGVLDFAGERCLGYDEWGKLSGFAEEGTVELPHLCEEK